MQNYKHLVLDFGSELKKNWLASASEVGIDWKMQSDSSKSEVVHGQRRQGDRKIRKQGGKLQRTSLDSFQTHRNFRDISAEQALHPFLYTHCWWHLALLLLGLNTVDDVDDVAEFVLSSKLKALRKRKL